MSQSRLNTNSNQYQKKIANGFSLLEVLIAVLILSIGMLGLAALHATSLKANHGAYYKSQATFLAYDIVDRLRANRTDAVSESYDNLISETSLTSGPALAVADVNAWLINVDALLPSGRGAIDCTTAGACVVDVEWDVAREGGTAQNSTDTTQMFTFTTNI